MLSTTAPFNNNTDVKPQHIDAARERGDVEDTRGWGWEREGEYSQQFILKLLAVESHHLGRPGTYYEFFSRPELQSSQISSFAPGNNALVAVTSFMAAAARSSAW